MSRTACTVACLATVVTLFTCGLLYAGPLDPPGGPISPTNKTLAEVEPRTVINAANTPGDADSVYKITLPGSYYLAGNLTGVAGKHGIEVAASGVTIDLSGFELNGTAAVGSFDGVSATVSNLTGIVVRNGTIRAWSRYGLNFLTVTGARVEGVTANGNTQIGIYAGRASVVTNCTSNGSIVGIATGAGSTVSDCAAYGASAQCISGAIGSIITRCTASGGAGIGIQVDNGVVEGCTVSSNTGFGISVVNGSTVTACESAQNTGGGFRLSFYSSISNCTAFANSATGVAADSSASVVNCHATQNTGHGFQIGSNGLISGCLANDNMLDGIQAGFGCAVRDNTCTGNGNGGDGAGIHITSTNSTIEGNNCIGNDRGVDVDLAKNTIIRNRCSVNSVDWDFVANNVYGPIIDRRTPASAAVTGFSAASTLASTDANANVSY